MGHRDNEEERRKPLENAIPFLTPTIFDVVPDTKLGLPPTFVPAEESGATRRWKNNSPCSGNGRQLPVTSFRLARPTRAMA